MEADRIADEFEVGNDRNAGGKDLLGFWAFCFVLFCFLGLHLWHMEVPRLGVKLEVQL